MCVCTYCVENKKKLNMKYFIVIASLLQTSQAAAQLIKFKDGKVGVNFLGYHAEAGLSGAHNGGGLHASAGTPWGQNAAAGLDGNINGRAAGILYAGAQATPDVGSGTALGGDTSKGGFIASDAYDNSKVSSHKRTIVVGNIQNKDENSYLRYPQHVPENINAIQKIQTHRKYSALEPPHHVRRQLIAAPTHKLIDRPCDPLKGECKNVNKEVRSDVVQNALQIPIGILKSLQQSLGNLESQ